MLETFEVEVKVPITDFEEMKQKLLDSGANQLNREVQVDTYFDHPCRTFYETDEAVRVRSRRPLDGAELDLSHALHELTYKGPKIDQKTKTRLEYSVDINDVNAITAILENLGFKSVATVSKKRTFYNLREITISIDDVEHIGLFLELESIAHEKSELESAKMTIFSLLDELGIDSSQSVRESYLELYLDRKKQ
jgi:adenylate cyclase class 2